MKYRITLICIITILLATYTWSETVSIDYQQSDDIDAGTYQQIWNKTIGIWGSQPLSFADLDSDGVLEIVTSPYVLDALTGEIEWELPIDGYGPSIGDLDNDSFLDIVVHKSEFVYAISGANNSIMWQCKLTDWGTDYVALADINGDNRLDASAGDWVGKLYAINWDGSFQWGTPSLGVFGRMLAPPALGDIDNDDRLDLIFTNINGWIIAYDSDRQEKWRKTLSDEIWGGPSIGDIDGDGNQDVIVGTDDGVLWAFEGDTGNKIWKYETHSFIRTSPALGDVTGDGQLDVVFSANTRIRAINAEDAALHWTYDLGSRPAFGPTLADLDGDDKLEVLTDEGTNGDRFTVLDGTSGAFEWEFMSNDSEHSGSGPPTAVDLDGDGTVEVVWGGDYTIYALDIQNSGRRIYWQSCGGTTDFTRTGCLYDVDPDLDMLSSYSENLIGTDPLNSDSDNDSIIDSLDIPTTTLTNTPGFIPLNLDTTMLLLGVSGLAIFVVIVLARRR